MEINLAAGAGSSASDGSSSSYGGHPDGAHGFVEMDTGSLIFAGPALGSGREPQPEHQSEVIARDK